LLILRGFSLRRTGIASYRPNRVRRKTKCWARFACFFLIGSTTSAQSAQPLSKATAERLRIPLARMHSPQLESQIIDFRSGIGPDEAATIALYSNPALRSIRDRRGLAVAQLIQAELFRTRRFHMRATLSLVA